jgi:peptide/nickel transport system permease protein
MIGRFLVRRVGLGLCTLFVISGVTFLLFSVVPTSPAQVACGPYCTPDRVAEVARQLELDRPLAVQYGRFLAGIVVGRTYGEAELARRCPAPCLGYSFRSDEPVTDLLGRTLPVTLSIVGGAAVIWLTLGVALGVLAARHHGTVFDRLAVGVSIAASSMQVFFFGLMLLLVFRYWLNWVPNPGYVPITRDPLGWADGMILPWCTLGFLFSASYIRLVRARMLDTLGEDYIRTARAKGLNDRAIYLRHALRPSINPVVTLAGLDIGAALGGTILTETIFSLNGLGRAAVQAVTALNLPVIMATVLLAASFIVVANIVVDVLYAVIDPRVRLG